MTDQERNQVLKMIEDGKITPEQGLHLMQALDQSPAEDFSSVPAGSPTADPQDATHIPASGAIPDPHVQALKASARRLWLIPLWIGIGLTVLSAFGMYAVMLGPGLNFWFYFLLLPLFLGVAVITLAAGSRSARWIYVDVRQHPGAYPQRLFLGFPLPLKLTAWFLRTFGSFIPDLRRTNVDEIIQLVESGFSGGEPLVVHVDEGDFGERVKVYIG